MTGDADSSTPAGEPDDDFFSAWDKPKIKRETPPTSRTATPPVVGRSPSPFLNPGAKDINRAASPLARSESASGDSKPAASRVTSSAALRKTAPSTGPRKANILGAKKTTKLGVKKVASDVIDFDEAEKKAKEEADRIQKLGYDPEAEEEAAAKAKKGDGAAILSPTPVSPVRGGFGSTAAPQKSSADVERIGMGMGRLGFGQVGVSKAAAPAKKTGTGGFGSVGPIKASEGKEMQINPKRQPLTLGVLDDSNSYASSKFGNQKSISSDEFFGKGTFDSGAQAEAKNRLQGFEGATSISSNAYFGRAEDQDTEDYGDLESTAKDFVRRFGITAGDDLDNLSQVVGEGATRLQGAIRAYLGS